MSQTRMLVARAAALSALALGIPYALSALVVPIAADTSWSRSALGLAFGVSLAAVTLAAPLSGMALDRLRDARPLMAGGALLMITGLVVSSQAPDAAVFALTFGIPTGLGAGALTVVAFAPLAGLARKGKAYGIAFAGGGIGTAAVLPATGAFAAVAGWRGALVALSGVVALVIAPLLRAPFPTATHVAGGADDGRAVSRGHLAGLLLAVALWAFLDETGFVTTAPHAIASGYGQDAAAALGMLVAAGFAAGVYAGGTLSDRVGRLPVLVIAGLVAAAGMLALAGMVEPFATAPLYGIALGAVVATRWAWTAEAFPTRAAGRVAGLTQVAYTVGGAPVGWIGGRAYESGGSYAPVFMIAAALAVVWAGVMAVTVSAETRRAVSTPIARFAVAVRAR
jgi:predicted MFS family arabinose efflux permease